MGCRACIKWYATNEQMWKNRIKNIANDGLPYPCPHCGTSDWATSRQLIKLDTQRNKSSKAYYFWLAIILTIAVLLLWWWLK